MTARDGDQPFPDEGNESGPVPLQGQAADEHAPSAPSRPNQYDVFNRAADAGNVWVSGLGIGAGSADVNVVDPEWCGGSDLARALFYAHLGTGVYSVLNARLVRW
ncbi:hypothetical protein [Amycolatopsis sp. NBC_00438]|uniref:hypothetical protein n=1 Tax=Amycolatopsis sp. NBC_00438 TaxID=2903558 RepID=UPI002E1C1A67